MNSKMTTNSQLSTTELKKNPKQTTRTGAESQKWRSHGGLSVGKGKGEKGEKVQGIRSIIGRYKVDKGRLRIIQEMEKPKNLHVLPMNMNEGGGNAGGNWGARHRSLRGEKNGTTVIAYSI